VGALLFSCGEPFGAKHIARDRESLVADGAWDELLSLFLCAIRYDWFVPNGLQFSHETS
jgi:hypothetical protein